LIFDEPKCFSVIFMVDSDDILLEGMQDGKEDVFGKTPSLL
jgi:hypothetical protein